MVLYFGFFSEDFNLSNAGEEKVWSLAGNYLLKLASKNFNFSNAGGGENLAGNYCNLASHLSYLGIGVIIGWKIGMEARDMDSF